MADTKISALTASTTPLAGTEVLPIVQSGTTKQVSVANLTAGRAVSSLSLSTTGGYTFRVADASAYELLRSVGATNNPGIFVKAIEATKKVSLYGSGSGISGQLLTLGAEAVEDSLRVSATDVTVAYGNLVIGTSGKGIDFSATPGTGTSELLADYEEGTWTPSLVPGTSGSITLTTAQAKYTKVGRAVTVTGICEVASVSSPVGALLLQGLPFANSADASSRSAAAIYATSLAVTATTSIMGRIIPSETQIRIEKFAAGSAAAMAGDVQANTIIQFNLTYFV